jgi:glycerol-1-phosphate dehydrogenase [NAD(P)+]
MTVELKKMYNELLLNNYYEIIDENGISKISIGRNLIGTKILTSQNIKILISDQVKPYFDIKLPTAGIDLDTIISIGNFYTHNEAKQLCKIKSFKLIICPAPLSNDSFCTNRYSLEKSSSSAYNYPDEVIIDLLLLTKLQVNQQIPGIGEFIGVYFSILDYYLSYNITPPMELIKYIYFLFEQLKLLIDGEYDQFLKQLAISIIIKCYIVRNSSDYQIGCGIDHLIAGALQSIYNFSHGKSVFLGSVISSIVLANWNIYGLKINELISFGLKYDIISIKDLLTINSLDFNYLFKLSIDLRPSRITYLSRLKNNTSELNFIKNAFSETIQNFIHELK